MILSQQRDRRYDVTILYNDITICLHSKGLQAVLINSHLSYYFDGPERKGIDKLALFYHKTEMTLT